VIIEIGYNVSQLAAFVIASHVIARPHPELLAGYGA